MASVYKRGGVWWVRFQWRGREVRKSSRTTVKGEAREYLAALQSQYRLIDINGAPRVLFDDAAAAYIEEEVSRKKVSTVAFYQACVRVLAQEFGGTYVDEISRGRIADFEAKQARRVSPSRLKHYRAAMSGIMRVALRHEWVNSNPCRSLDPIQVSNARYRFLSRKEWDRLRRALPEPHRTIAALSVERGMRAGEILALRHEDLDFRADVILLRDTKANVPRAIPMEGARELLPMARRGLVFSTEKGKPLSVSEVTRKVNAVAREIGVGDFTFHDLRHTFASWYVQAGGDLYRLQRILGHKGPAMTQRYAHLRIEDLRAVTQKSAQRT